LNIRVAKTSTSPTTSPPVATETFVKKRIGATEIAILAMATAIYTVLAMLNAGFTIAGLALIYVPYAFAVVAAMWFGVWGAMGAYFGTVLMSPFWGYGYPIGAVFGVPDVLSPIIVGLALRKLSIDPTLRDKRSFFLWILIGALVAPSIEALTAMPVFIALGWYTPQYAFTYGYALYVCGDALGLIIVGTILMRALSGYMTKTSLYFKNFIYRQVESA